MKMKINLQGTDKILLDNFANRLDKAMFLYANDLRNEIVENKLSGNPVRRRTGNLANSIAVHRTSALNYEIGSFGVRYAKFLEYAKKLQRYRWLAPSVQKWAKNKNRLSEYFRRVK